MPKTRYPNLPPRVVRARIAALAECDERTVLWYLSGQKRTVPATVAAIQRAATELGIELPRPAVAP